MLERHACSNLYDIFAAIRDDEMEHVSVMTACRDYSIIEALAERKASEGAQTTMQPVATMDKTQLN